MQFVYPALAGAFLLALLPLLIHVINLVRHQRVEWAAMEFLLASYKKHRRWVWLKQFLLMVSRIAIIAPMCSPARHAWRPHPAHAAARRGRPGPRSLGNVTSIPPVRLACACARGVVWESARA